MTSDAPGLTRKLTGKLAAGARGASRRIPDFVLLDDKGRTVRDEAAHARVRSLAIPPAWKDVWICRHPRGHLQAVGRDARGRKQYRYHPAWRTSRDENKYQRLESFARALPALRRQLSHHLRLPGLPREKVLASVVRLLETTFIRVGNDQYERSNHSYGLTTLKDRHVSFKGDRVHFRFRGKSGVFHDVTLRDPRMARIVRQCRDIPGHELFQYRDHDGNAHAIGSHDVNAYIRAHMGDDFTAKDFRTWAGTRLALRSLTLATEELARASAQQTRRAAPTAQQVKQAIEAVAAQLGNTPAVCRKCYVHPAVIAAYLNGTLRPMPPLRIKSPVPKGLDAEERELLALLRRTVASGDSAAAARNRKHTDKALVDQLRRSLSHNKARRAHSPNP